MILQLNPPIPIETPRGKAQAMFLIDYSPEHDIHWVSFLDDSGECWTFSNREIRAQTNLTLGRKNVYPPRSYSNVTPKPREVSLERNGSDLAS